VRWARHLSAAYALFAAATPLAYLGLVTEHPVPDAAAMALLVASVVLMRRGYASAARDGYPVAGAALASLIALISLASILAGAAIAVVGGPLIVRVVSAGLYMLGALTFAATLVIAAATGPIRMGARLGDRLLMGSGYVIGIGAVALLINAVTLLSAEISGIGLAMEGIGAATAAAALSRRREKSF